MPDAPGSFLSLISSPSLALKLDLLETFCLHNKHNLYYFLGGLFSVLNLHPFVFQG